MTQNNNIQTSNNIFSLFPQYTLEQANVTQKPMSKISVNSSIERKEDSIELTKKKSSKAKKIIFGSTLASTIITAGIVSMFFAKGFHGSSLKKLTKFKEKLAREISESSSNKGEGITQKAVLYTKKGTQKAIDGLEATSNFAAIKDWTCDKILRLNKVTAKFADKQAAINDAK